MIRDPSSKRSNSDERQSESSVPTSKFSPADHAQLVPADIATVDPWTPQLKKVLADHLRSHTQELDFSSAVKTPHPMLTPQQTPMRGSGVTLHRKGEYTTEENSVAKEEEENTGLSLAAMSLFPRTPANFEPPRLQSPGITEASVSEATTSTSPPIPRSMNESSEAVPFESPRLQSTGITAASVREITMRKSSSSSSSPRTPSTGGRSSDTWQRGHKINVIKYSSSSLL